METQVKKSRLASTPDWAWASFTVMALVVILRIGHDPKSSDFGTLQILVWIAYLVVLSVACFLICRKYPKSVWYVPLISNIIGIIGLFANIGMAIARAILERGHRTTSTEWIFVIGSVLLSVTAAIAGARIGQRKVDQENINQNLVR